MGCPEAWIYEVSFRYSFLGECYTKAEYWPFEANVFGVLRYISKRQYPFTSPSLMAGVCGTFNGMRNAKLYPFACRSWFRALRCLIRIGPGCPRVRGH